MEEQNQIIEQLQYINNSISNLDASITNINNSIMNSGNNFGFILILIVLISACQRVESLANCFPSWFT